MSMRKGIFGKTSNGEVAHIITIANNSGMSIEVTDYGATLVSVSVPDKEGRLSDVVLGYDDVTDYERNTAYLGATIGRIGNRIAKASFSIDGKEYFMDKNEGENVCHSGPHGYHGMLWQMELREEENMVAFHHVSPHLEQGIPGRFDVTVTYQLTDENEIRIHYSGCSDRDTIVNMTNHSYFNLAGHESGKLITGHEIWIDADAFTPVGEDLIPTGEIRPVEGTYMDFRTAKKIGRDIDAADEQLRVGGGYDHNFVLNHYDGTVRKVAEVFEEGSGRKLEVFTDLPGMQMYAGNFLGGGSVGKDGAVYRNRSGLALETQYFPDAVHHANFPQPFLKAGEPYDTTTVYRITVANR